MLGRFKMIEYRGNVKLMEETLSDGSKVYDINIGDAVSIHAVDEKEAWEVFRYLSGKSISVWMD